MNKGYAPTRKDISQEFVLRGSVICECGNCLTAGWSKSKTGKRHPYYNCQTKRCDHYGKSIRRDVIEGEFEALLKKLTPTHALFNVAKEMFRSLWNHREASQQGLKENLGATKQVDRAQGRTNIRSHCGGGIATGDQGL